MNTIVNITGQTLKFLKANEENDMLNKKEKKKLYDKEYSKKRYEQLKEIFKNNPRYKKDYYNEINLKRKNSVKRTLWRRKYEKEKRKKDLNFKVANNLRRRINNSLKGLVKSKKTFQLLGCNLEQLWIHLEKSFKPGMTKENYGKWHIDHIRPCASFDLSKPEEQAKCFHYTNLQALWAQENQSKSAKFDNF